MGRLRLPEYGRIPAFLRTLGEENGGFGEAGYAQE
jgi:hypothetical protein